MRLYTKFLILVSLSLLFLICSNPDKAYKNVKKVNTIHAYSKFIKKYPESIYINEVKLILDSLIYNSVLERNNINEHEKFIQNYPNSGYILKVKERNLNQEILFFKI